MVLEARLHVEDVWRSWTELELNFSAILSTLVATAQQALVDGVIDAGPADLR